jgi:hypothetical protein
LQSKKQAMQSESGSGRYCFEQRNKPLGGNDNGISNRNWSGDDDGVIRRGHRAMLKRSLIVRQAPRIALTAKIDNISLTL